MVIIAKPFRSSLPFAALRSANKPVASAAPESSPKTYPPIDPEAVPGRAGYCEVPEDLGLARLEVCDGPLGYPAAGVSAHGSVSDSSEMIGLRAQARRLDARLAQRKEAAEEAETFAAEDEGSTDAAPPMADDEVIEPEQHDPDVDVSLVELAQACIEEEGCWQELLSSWGVPDDEIDTILDAARVEQDGAFADGVLARVEDTVARRAADAEADAIDAQVREEMAELMARLRTSPTGLPAPQPVAELLRSPLPAGYTFTREGLFCQLDPDKPPVRLSLTPVMPVCLMRTADDTDWSFCLKAVSYDGKPVTLWFPMASLYANMGKLVAELAQHGVLVEDERRFRTFLLRCLEDRDALPRQRGTQKMGFAPLPTQDGSLKVGYVLPEQTIVPTGVALAEDLILFDSVKTAVHQAFHASGSLEDWQALAERTRGHALYTFALCLAFGAPLLSVSNTENGAIHFFAKTSLGKTLIEQLAATVFGCGAAPNFGGSPSLVLSWHGTGNAIEAQIASLNGPLIIIDDVGHQQGPVSIFGSTGGVTKGRAQGDGRLQASQTWSALILSTGEEAIAHQIQTQGRRPIKGGEAARFTDVPAYGLLAAGDAAVVEALKRDCGRTYGTAGVRFLQYVLDRFAGDPVDMQVTVSGEVDRLRDQLCDEARAQGFALDTQHPRAMRRLALAALGGLWAVEAGILPHTEEEVMAAVRAVRDAWLSAQPFVSEAKRAIDTVRDYYLRFRGQMIESGHGPRPLPNNCHGILHQGKMILPDDAFREACAGLDSTLVLACLKDAGLLHQDDDQSKAHTKIAELGLRGARMVHIWLEPLLAEPETVSADDQEAVPPAEDGESDEDFADDDLNDL